MPRSATRLVALAAFALTLLLIAARSASADEVAPELEPSDLRWMAQAELRKLVLALPTGERRALVGTYVAFDENAAEPIALAACDDDGDHVVVISVALLRLASYLARTATGEDAERRVDEYAALVAHATVAGKRLLPPPPGYFAADPNAAAIYEARLGGTLGFLLARELSHLRAGDVVCPHPTATHESGDDVWTAAEKAHAEAAARTVYLAGGEERAASRDRAAVELLLDASENEAGALTLLRFFVQLEAARSTADIGAASFSRLHPSSAKRLVTIQAVSAARAAAAKGAR